MKKQDMVTVEGLDLEVSIRGSGEPLLLLNGLGARFTLFDNVRTELPQFQTIAFNQPGIGQSQAPGRLDMSDYARLTIGLMDELGFRQPVDVLGVSWGGCLAQELTFRYPQRVRRLILASTSPSPFVLTSPAVYWAFLDSRRYESPQEHRRIASTLYGGPMRDNPELVDTVLEHLDEQNSPGRALQQRAALGWTSLYYLWRLRKPTLVLGADDDPIIRPYNAHLLATLIPRATKHIMVNEGHLFLLTSPQETARRVVAFLQTTRATSRKRAVQRRTKHSATPGTVRT